MSKKESDQEMNEESKPEIAFKDFKGSITKDEFEAVLSMASEEYKSCARVLESKDLFDIKGKEAFDSINSQSKGMPPGFAEKLIEGLKRKASREAGKLLKNEIIRSNSIVDFLNRFQNTEEMLPYLDFKDLKN
jgi:hypothetical protein